MAIVTPVNGTYLKLDTKQASNLPPEQKRFREANDPLKIISVDKGPENHWVFHFSPPGLTIGPAPVLSCLAWPDDWEGVGDIFAKVQELNRVRSIGQSTPLQGPKTFKVLDRDASGKVVRCALDVAYKSQVDNALNPGGACNVTCIAMGLTYFDLAKDGEEQLEDRLYAEMEANGKSRHSPYHLQQLAIAYGMTDNFAVFATMAEIKQSIENGRPCIIHGWFTGSGHIVMIVGFDDKGFVVHDPWGEWTSSGYLRNDAANPQRGRYTHYSYGMIDAKCRESDGSFWCHFLDRPGWNPTQTSIAPQNTQKPSNLSTVTANVATVLKSLPIAASDSRQTAKAAFPAGKSIECVISNAPGDHILITLPNSDKIEGRDTWYAYRGHCTISTPGGESDRTPGATLTLADFEAAATEIGIETAMLQALVQVECAGSGFLDSGKPKILFEAQWFGFDSDDRWSDSHPQISKREWDRDQYFGGEAEYDRLNQAIALDKTAALGAASWGLGQVLGRNATSIGYDSVEQFVDLMYKNEFEHLRSIGRFVSSNPTLLKAMQRRDFGTIALCYNGELHWKHNYSGRLEGAYQSFVG
jgi:uncharacterized protein YvpB